VTSPIKKGQTSSTVTAKVHHLGDAPDSLNIASAVLAVERGAIGGGCIRCGSPRAVAWRGSA
jgi:hypothetical protein